MNSAAHKAAPYAAGSLRDSALKAAMQQHSAGLLDDAASAYGELHAVDPHDTEVMYLMGILCCDLGLFEPACGFLQEALRIAPLFPEARAQLAVALGARAKLLMASGNFAAAKSLLELALEHASGAERVEALNSLGLAQLLLHDHGAAELTLRSVLQMQPDIVAARNHLGLALYYQCRLDEARICFEEVLARDPDYHRARVNLASILRVLGRFHEARCELETVLETRENDADALNNLGAVFQDTGRHELAVQVLENALALAPTSPEIRWNLAISQLALGDFADGWRNFEARWDGCATLRGGYSLPRAQAWAGESLVGKRLLLWAEQGFGDTLQFVRFAQDVAALGATVDLLAPPELTELLRSARGVNRVLKPGETASPYDMHCPLMSLPHLLGVTLGTAALHGDSPYLRADLARNDHWASRLARCSGLKIGLAWAGRARAYSPALAAIDVRRSVSLSLLQPLLSVSGCTFVSLQAGEPAASEARMLNEDCARSSSSIIHDFSSEWRSFADTAAVIANLDLVISVDTAVAHLAGALGKPVWLMNRHDSCWRWLLQRNDSPWYRSLVQFRQQSLGDWHTVIARVTQELRALAAAH